MNNTMLKKMLPTLFVIALAFYVLPLFIVDTGSAMVILLAITPAICLAASFSYGFLNGFTPYYTLLTAVLFLPAVFVYYNVSAFVYLVMYAFLTLLGVWLGSVVNRRHTL